MLIDFLKTRRGIPFNEMFAMKDYPSDVMPLYSQGHSLAQWLIESRGRKAFLEFLADGMQDENWPRAVQRALRFRRPVHDANRVARLGEARPAATDAGDIADRATGGEHADCANRWREPAASADPAHAEPG